MADHLSGSSLEWSLQHLVKFGDTDILPVPHEYEAIAADWASILPRLLTVNLATYEPRALARFWVPKPEGGFRLATRLDPLDAIIYTAAVLEASELLEKHRVKASEHIACSYRLSPSPDGNFFAEDNGWEEFHSRSKTLAEQLDCDWVAIADIADFYSQIGHHRVENALEGSGVRPNRAKALERLLSNWGALQSRGLPVGPRATIPLAEIVLNDVDLHLLGEGLTYTRYVDDYRIFCRTRSEAYAALHTLSDYLYSSHRLALQGGKTVVIPATAFIEKWLENPAFVERQAKSRKIEEYIKHIYNLSGYAVSEEDLGDEDQMAALREAIVELFDVCVASSPFRLGLARHILRRAAQMRTNVILTRTLEELETLTPVLRDAIGYLSKSRQKKSSEQVVQRLVVFAKSSDLSFLPFVQEWLLHALTESYLEEASPYLTSIESISTKVLGTRAEARLAKAQRKVQWVRRYKEYWKNAGPWDRREIIAAGSILTGDERGFWKETVLASDDPLDHAMAAKFL